MSRRNAQRGARSGTPNPLRIDPASERKKPHADHDAPAIPHDESQKKAPVPTRGRLGAASTGLEPGRRKA
jgi:hypothetical protein